MAQVPSRKRKIIIGADYWFKLLNSLRQEIYNTAIEVNTLIEILLKYANDILLFSNNWNKYKVKIEELEKIRKDVLFAGVDSSLTPPIRLGPYLTSAISAAAVITEGISSNPLKMLEVDFARAPESSDAENAYYEIKIKMFKSEIRMLGRSMSEMKKIDEKDEREKIVFIDGPIVDPPTFPRKNQKLRDSYENDYVKTRVSYILNGLNEKFLILGVVKKIEGNLLISRLLQDRSQTDVFQILNDYTLTTLILRSWNILKVLRDSIKDDEDIVLVTKAFELSMNTDYSIYRNNGLYVYSFYMLPGLRDPKKRVLRVEIPFDQQPSESDLEKYVWKCARYITAATLPGHNIPIPVILAHNACTIPRSTAKKVMKEVASKFLTANLRENTSLELAGIIDLTKGLIE